MDYSKLSGDQINQTIAKLVGWKVEYEPEGDDEERYLPAAWVLNDNNGDLAEIVFVDLEAPYEEGEEAAWKLAPKFATDLNEAISLVGELTFQLTHSKLSDTWSADIIDGANVAKAFAKTPARAICESWLIWKEKLAKAAEEGVLQ